MGKVVKNKLRTLIILDALLEQTDDNHRLSVRKLIEICGNHGIDVERKSIYDDIETLSAWGLDVNYCKEAPDGYYVGERDFQLAEVKLLVDAVQASKFITAKKSNELIKKLEKLTSCHDAKTLKRQVLVANEIKTGNENIYYNVDDIHTAIQRNVQISFQYMIWNMKGELVPKRKTPYRISPWALTWDDENYYMLGYDAVAGIIKHYRVDKMRGVKVTRTARDGRDAFNALDLDKYTRQTFGMFGGNSEWVTLECDNSMIGPIIDRFGSDTIIEHIDDKHFRVNQKVVVSNQFFGWVVGLGSGVRIAGPEKVVEKYQAHLEDMLHGIG